MKFDALIEEFDLTEANTFERRLVCDMRPHSALEACHLSRSRIVLSLFNANENGHEALVFSAIFEKDENDDAVFSRMDGNEKMSGDQILKELGVQDTQDPRQIIDALIDLFPKKVTSIPRARG